MHGIKWRPRDASKIHMEWLSDRPTDWLTEREKQSERVTEWGSTRPLAWSTDRLTFYFFRTECSRTFGQATRSDTTGRQQRFCGQSRDQPLVHSKSLVPSPWSSSFYLILWGSNLVARNLENVGRWGQLQKPHSKESPSQLSSAILSYAGPGTWSHTSSWHTRARRICTQREASSNSSETR